MASLLGPLAIVAAMIGLTSLLHLLGLLALLRLAGHHIRNWRTSFLLVDRTIIPLFMVLGLFIVHALEILAYAALFRFTGTVTNWIEALYFSAGSYSTLGYEGIKISQAWRLIASGEALNGLVLTGWSTAFLFRNLDRILIDEEEHPLPESAIASASNSKEDEVS